MVATLCLFTCALAATQPPPGGGWQAACQLGRGQELVYGGSYAEETTGQNVLFQRSYRLESRVFILDTTAQGCEAAFLTILKERPARGPAEAVPPEACCVHLDLAHINPQGRVIPVPGSSLAVPLEGPAASECAAFVEFARGRVAPGRTWEVADEERPPRTWQCTGTDSVQGTPCLKFTGLQQSDDWDTPRADHTAWRRLDTVWVAPNLGVAYRFERSIEKREPARQEPTHRTVTSYTLDSRMIYPGLLYEDRRREILLVHHLTDKLKPLLREPEKAGPKPFEEALARIAYHMDNHPATPYREAVKPLKRRLEAARRGEAPAREPAPEAAPVAPVIAVGRPAPDFVVPDLKTRESARLRKFLGRPILMVFYSPTSRNATEILRFAQSLADSKRSGITVLGFAVSDDTDRVTKHWDELQLSFPLLSGQGLHLTYALEATPKFVVLDAGGIVRSAYVGWGRETPKILAEELNRWKHPG
jgi:peroxiredoxin